MSFNLKQLAARGYDNARTAIGDAALKAGVVAVTALPVLASAQTADPFDTAVATVQTKVVAYGASLVGLAAAVVAALVAIKYVKKIPRAA